MNKAVGSDYRAVFFDWDGTAVLNRSAPVENVVKAMSSALDHGKILIIISGTTWDRIAEGQLNRFFTASQLERLYLGLARGACNYGFDRNGELKLLHHCVPDRAGKQLVDEIAFSVHQKLFADYGLSTDIVFSRPNYCKIDMMVNLDRGNAQFLQDSEIDQLECILKQHGIMGGVIQVIELAERIAKDHGVQMKATTDAKYLELGLSTKSNNVDFFMTQVLAPKGITAEECCFWGDEFRYIGENLPGSDAQMITDLTRNGDFFDVSGVIDELPAEVIGLGGKVERFLDFLGKI